MPSIAELKKTKRHRTSGFIQIEPSTWRKILKVLTALKTFEANWDDGYSFEDVLTAFDSLQREK